MTTSATRGTIKMGRNVKEDPQFPLGDGKLPWVLIEINGCVTCTNRCGMHCFLVMGYCNGNGIE